MNDRIIAYFSMEIALDPAMPTYAGGLGVLAGDTIRSAAELKVPMVAVSLLHRRGYLSQRFDASGWQHEEPTEWPVEKFPRNSRSVCRSQFNGAPFTFAPGNTT